MRGWSLLNHKISISILSHDEWNWIKYVKSEVKGIVIIDNVNLNILKNKYITHHQTHNLDNPRWYFHTYRYFKCCNTKTYKVDQGATSPRNYKISSINLRFMTYIILFIHENKTPKAAKPKNIKMREPPFLTC